MTPTSLSDEDDVLECWRLLPLEGCSWPESGAVCVGAEPTLCGHVCSEQLATLAGVGRGHRPPGPGVRQTGAPSPIGVPQAPHKPQGPQGIPQARIPVTLSKPAVLHGGGVLRMWPFSGIRLCGVCCGCGCAVSPCGALHST